MTDRRVALINAYTTFTFFTVFAGQFWRNLLGWWGFGVIVLVLLGGAVTLVAAKHPPLARHRVPASLLAFLVLTVASLAWSAYPAASLLGVISTLVTAVTAVTITLHRSWAHILHSLGTALAWIIGLSFLFEIWVGLIRRAPLLPNFVDYGTGSVPKAFYWSQGLLPQCGPLDGIVGNRNLLGMIGLLGIIVFACLLNTGSVSRRWGWGWLTAAILTVALTRSATVILCTVVVAVALGCAVWARRTDPTRRHGLYLTVGAVGVATVTAAVLGRTALLAVLGRSDDLTGRIDIWNAVIGLAQQRPLAGWGWISYWAPWVHPFEDLAVRKGVTYLQAHNAWLDLWLQLGIIGVVAFGALVAGALWRTWFAAIDRAQDAAGRPLPFTALSLAPLLLLVALLGQSLAESRLLIEGNLLLLVVIAWLSKDRQRQPDPYPVELLSGHSYRWQGA